MHVKESFPPKNNNNDNDNNNVCVSVWRNKRDNTMIKRKRWKSNFFFEYIARRFSTRLITALIIILLKKKHDEEKRVHMSLSSSVTSYMNILLDLEKYVHTELM